MEKLPTKIELEKSGIRLNHGFANNYYLLNNQVYHINRYRHHLDSDKVNSASNISLIEDGLFDYVTVEKADLLTAMQHILKEINDIKERLSNLG